MKNPWIAEQRAVFAEEVAAHKTEIAGMLLSEGTPLHTCESLLNRVLLVRSTGLPGYTIIQMLQSGFYGPINRKGLHYWAVAASHSQQLAGLFAAIDQTMAGSDEISGFTDQGLLTDPNGWRQPRLVIREAGGVNVFNDWNGGVHGISVGYVKAEAWRQWFETSALQASLKALLNPQMLGGLEIDGKPSAALVEAISEFQQENPPLHVDGIAGPKTWSVINQKLAAAVATA